MSYAGILHKVKADLALKELSHNSTRIRRTQKKKNHDYLESNIDASLDDQANVRVNRSLVVI